MASSPSRTPPPSTLHASSMSNSKSAAGGSGPASRYQPLSSHQISTGDNDHDDDGEELDIMTTATTTTTTTTNSPTAGTSTNSTSIFKTNPLVVDEEDDDDDHLTLLLNRPTENDEAKHHFVGGADAGRDGIFRDANDSSSVSTQDSPSNTNKSAGGAAVGGNREGATPQTHGPAITPSKSAGMTRLSSGGGVQSSSSWDFGTGSGDFMDEEDDVVVRRYTIRNRIPIVPAEFAHQPLPQRLWRAFLDLRTAARQRRAARLLSSGASSNSSSLRSTTRQTLNLDCFLTWCCDATDRGIALVAVLLLLWLIIGWMFTVPVGYWLFGTLLFIIRVSARTTYEFLVRKLRSGHPLFPIRGVGNSSSRVNSTNSVVHSMNRGVMTGDHSGGRLELMTRESGSQYRDNAATSAMV